MNETMHTTGFPKQQVFTYSEVDMESRPFTNARGERNQGGLNVRFHNETYMNLEVNSQLTEDDTTH